MSHFPRDGRFLPSALLPGNYERKKTRAPIVPGITRSLMPSFGAGLAREPSWHPEEILTKINDTHLKMPVKDYGLALITAGACLHGHQMMIARNREDINVIGKVQQTKIPDESEESKRMRKKSRMRFLRHTDQIQIKLFPVYFSLS